MQSLLSCPVCNSHVTRVRYRETLTPEEKWQPGFNPYSGHYRINTCEGCGLIYSSPVFDDSEIIALYEAYPETNVDEAEISNVEATMAGYYRMASTYLSKRERVLDVGCDIGLFLKVARQDGFRELHGIEPVAVARKAARERLPGAHIHADFYQDTQFPDDHFDLVTFIHVVDHLVSPVETLERAWRNMRPGGVILAVVHDIEAPLARLMGERYPVYNFFHHYFFSRQTLANLFERCGFETLSVQATKNRYSLAFLIERFPLAPRTMRMWLSKLSRSLEFGKFGVKMPIGNIGIVARKPAN